MRSAFSFQGELSRAAYATAAAAVFFSQYAVVWGVLALSGGHLAPTWWFWFTPLRALVFGDNAWSGVQPPLDDSILLLGMGHYIVIDWLLVAMSFRRARQAGVGLIWPALAVIPILQALLIVSLSLAPARSRTDEAPAPEAEMQPRAIALGVLIGAAICVAAVAFSTLVLRLYGFGLFIATPFAVGAVTAYIARRNGETSLGSAIAWALIALVVCAGALIAFAIEGLICIIAASPLIAAMGTIGALLGYALAHAGAPRSKVMTSLALLPVLMVGELAVPPSVSFESAESVEISASPAEVWDAITHMEPIPEPPIAPFSWGLAYPLSGQLDGAGVGAVRRGVFSTGVAYERVTEWAPDETLNFAVLSDPPMMHELSPYEHVHAPHVAGYFRTRDARFTITPLHDGRTRLTLTTHHDLDLEPALYWLPFAQWAVSANKSRVLDHFRQQAERASRA